MRQLQKLFCVVVNSLTAGDCPFLNADTATIGTGLDNQRIAFFFNADHLTQQTANGSDLITDLLLFTDFLLGLFLVVLGTDHQEIHHQDHDRKRNDHRPNGSLLRCICRQSNKIRNHKYFILSLSGIFPNSYDVNYTKLFPFMQEVICISWKIHSIFTFLQMCVSNTPRYFC